MLKMSPLNMIKMSPLYLLKMSPLYMLKMSPLSFILPLKMRRYQPLHEILSQPRRSNAASTLSSLQCPEAEGGLLEDQNGTPQQGMER
jgi:hypothetical protein